MKKLFFICILFFGIFSSSYASFNSDLSAAKNGDPKAQYEVGLIYYSKNNFTEAATWMRLAAIAGNVEAQIFVGRMFEEGKGFKKAMVNALYWVSKAANNGSEDAKKELKLLRERDKKNKAEKILADRQEAENILIAEKKIQAELSKEISKSHLLEREKIERAAKSRRFLGKFNDPMIMSGIIILGILLLLFLRHLMTRDSKEQERLRQRKLRQDSEKAKREEEERVQKEVEKLEREEEEEILRLQELSKQAERDRVYALQQKKLVYLKADKYLNEFESHLPFKLSANYADLRIIYDEGSSSTQASIIDNQTSFKDGRLWEALISLLVGEHPLDTMSSIYFAKIRSLIDDEDYLVIGETSLEIQDFFDRSTQLELVDLISTSLMPKPIALFVVLHLSREFRYADEEERAESEFKLEHYIIKENSKVKVQKLFTKLDEYATKCVDSYADISSKEYDQLESNQDTYVKDKYEDYEADEKPIDKEFETDLKAFASVFDHVIDALDPDGNEEMTSRALNNHSDPSRNEGEVTASDYYLNAFTGAMFELTIDSHMTTSSSISMFRKTAKFLQDNPKYRTKLALELMNNWTEVLEHMGVFSVDEPGSISLKKILGSLSK